MNRPRVRALYFEWPSTKGNHAGMAYFAKCLKRDIGFPFPLLHYTDEVSFERKDKKINLAKHYARLTMPWTDCLFLMEYLSPVGIANQETVAMQMRQWGFKKKIVGLVHLPESELLRYWTMEYICSSLDALDYIIVYGSSLAKFFERIGYGHKVRLVPYYVDTDYYHPLKEKNNSTLKVHFCGSLLRNDDILKEIIQQCPDVSFQICVGLPERKAKFAGLPNVTAYEYLSENELLLRTQQADASISVMEDTIGSNAIVAGLACGLPQIVSDVGSIRDYCSQDNAILCKDTGDFIKAIQWLSQNRDSCRKMGDNARKRAEELSMPVSVNWFRDFFISIGK